MTIVSHCEDNFSSMSLCYEFSFDVNSTSASLQECSLKSQKEEMITFNALLVPIYEEVN